MLAAALRLSAEELVAHPDRPVTTRLYDQLIARRAAHEPVARITGHREFWSLQFEVSPETLVPRPETETLVEAALTYFRDRPAPLRIADLGTGTGCLLLAVLLEFPGAFGIGVDLSAGAVVTARRNARTLHLGHRAAFVQANWTAPLAGPFDLVLSNPPYIESAAIPGLMPEVARHDPLLSLDGGPDGLAAYRHLIPRLPPLLAPRGAAILELGAGQLDAVSAVAIAAGLTTSWRADLAGTPRAIVLCNTLPRKNRLAEREGASSFSVVAGLAANRLVDNAP